MECVNAYWYFDRKCHFVSFEMMCIYLQVKCCSVEQAMSKRIKLLG